MDSRKYLAGAAIALILVGCCMVLLRSGKPSPSSQVPANQAKPSEGGEDGLSKTERLAAELAKAFAVPPATHEQLDAVKLTTFVADLPNGKKMPYGVVSNLAAIMERGDAVNPSGAYVAAERENGGVVVYYRFRGSPYVLKFDWKAKTYTRIPSKEFDVKAHEWGPYSDTGPDDAYTERFIVVWITAGNVPERHTVDLVEKANNKEIARYKFPYGMDQGIPLAGFYHPEMEIGFVPTTRSEVTILAFDLKSKELLTRIKLGKLVKGCRPYFYVDANAKVAVAVSYYFDWIMYMDLKDLR